MNIAGGDVVLGGSPSSSSGAAGGKKNTKKDAAVAGWMQRVEDRSRLQQQHQQHQQHAPLQMREAGAREPNPNSTTRKNRKQLQQGQVFSMEQMNHVPSNSSHVDLNYSKDDSSEDDVYGVDFDDNVLETIAG